MIHTKTLGQAKTQTLGQTGTGRALGSSVDPGVPQEFDFWAGDRISGLVISGLGIGHLDWALDFWPSIR